MGAVRLRRVGLAAGDITPRLPCPMGGYGARTAPAQAVHDPLTVQALFLDGVLWLCFDLLLLRSDDVARIRRAAADASGVAPGDIVVSCTHTHAGPATVALPPQEQAAEEYLQSLPGRAAPVARRAVAQARPAIVVAGSFRSSVGANRRDPAKPADTTNVFWAFFDDPTEGDGAGARWPTGPLRGVLLQTACHPTVLPPENLAVSADFIGGLRAAWSRARPDAWLGVVNGAAGDISTRFTRRAQNFDEAWRLGQILHEELERALAQAPAEAPAAGHLRMLRDRVALPRKDLPSPEAARARLAEAEARWREARRRLEAGEIPPGEERLYRTAFEGAQSEWALLQSGRWLEDEAEVVVLDLGAFGAVVLPGEPFSSLGQAVRGRSPWAETMVAGYSNGHVGYLPDRTAYEEGGYEALAAHVAPEAGERLVEAAARLLSRRP